MEIKDLFDDVGCELQVLCGKNWEELDATEENGIRFCGECKKLVFYAKNPTELKIAAQRNLCVYFQPATHLDQFDQTMENIKHKKILAMDRILKSNLFIKQFTGSIKLKD
jgi:hypothetical protein